jgi:hypothetical protein
LQKINPGKVKNMNKLTYTTSKKGKLSISINGKVLEIFSTAFLIKRQQLKGINLHEIPRDCEFIILDKNGKNEFPRVHIRIESKSKASALIFYTCYEEEWLEDMGLSLLEVDIIRKSYGKLKKKVRGFKVVDLNKDVTDPEQKLMFLNCWYEIKAPTTDHVLNEVDRIVKLINSVSENVIKQYRDALDTELAKL